MKEITVNGNDYKLEFSFEAAERKDFVSMMFRIVSGAALLEDAADMENPTPKDMINGTINMVSDIPHICRTGFFVGLSSRYITRKLKAHFPNQKGNRDDSTTGIDEPEASRATDKV